MLISEGAPEDGGFVWVMVWVMVEREMARRVSQERPCRAKMGSRGSEMGDLKVEGQRGRGK